MSWGTTSGCRCSTSSSSRWACRPSTRWRGLSCGCATTTSSRPSRARIEKAGRDFAKELNNLWVSPVLHKALVEEGLGASTSDISKSLAQQFPNVKDITIDEMLRAIREALTVKGQMPGTLIVLDEVQQFIGEDSDRSLQIQEVVEACSQAAQ